MTPDAFCPACRMPVHAAGRSHLSGDGPVHYVRCLCGRWVVLVAGAAVASAGSPEVQTRAPEVQTRALEVQTRAG